MSWKYIQFDGATGKRRTVSGGGGGGSSTLADLDDVDLSSPSDGQILHYDNATSKWVNATPSNSGHNYSTTEQVVGTWIDGKPIYEKTVSIGAIAANTIDYKVDCSILTVDTLVDINCIVLSGTNFFRLPLALLQQGSTYSNYGINIQGFDTTTGKLRIDTGGSRTINSGHVTIQYTKTTAQGE